MEEASPKKANEKEQREKGAGLFLRSLCEKGCIIVQTVNRVLSDKLLGRC